MEMKKKFFSFQVTIHMIMKRKRIVKTKRQRMKKSTGKICRYHRKSHPEGQYASRDAHLDYGAGDSGLFTDSARSDGIGCNPWVWWTY